MATPCVPTLGATTFVTDPGQILAIVLRSYITLPKSRSDIYTDEIISYMDDVSRISYDMTVFSETVEASLSSAYDRIFKGSGVSVSVTCTPVVTTGTNYDVELTIVAQDSNYTYTMLPLIANSNGSFNISNDTVHREFNQ